MRKIALMLALSLTAAHAEDSKLTIAYVPAADFAPIMVAKDRGYFTNHGIDATLTVIPLISNIPAGLISGSLQIGATTGPIFLQAAENGLDLVAVAGVGSWTPDNQTASLIAGTGSGITTPQDLVGKRVAVPGFNSLMDLIFRRWAISKGIQLTSLTEVEASFPAMGDLLRTHQVGAAMVIEPFRDFALSSGAGSRLADPAREVSTTILASFYIAERGWATAHPKDIAGFRAALREGIETLTTDPSARAIETKYLKVTTKILPHYTADITLADLQFHEDLAKQFGLVEGKADLQKLILP
jgi:NitT/TauT family transport system substrate-binding protein